MAKIWTFKDYVSPAGENEIHRWLDGLPSRVKRKINVQIEHLEVMAQLKMPYVRPLKGECDGLMELRITWENVQYRPLCCYGPGQKEVTILVGAIEKGSKFEPKSACSIALKRKQELDERSCTCDHDFSSAKATDI